MRILRNTLFAVAVAGVITGLAIALSPREAATGPASPLSSPPAVASASSDQSQAPPRPKSVAVDRKKDGGLKERKKDDDDEREREKRPPRSNVKAISLVEAVAAAEALGQGSVVKVERRDKPEVSFKIDLLAVDGSKKKIELTADGRVRPHEDRE